jgi:hypothetical protein
MDNVVTSIISERIEDNEFTKSLKLQYQEISSSRDIQPMYQLRTSEKPGFDPHNTHAAIAICRGSLVYRASHRRWIAHERIRFPLEKIELGRLVAIDAQQPNNATGVCLTFCYRVFPLP